MKKMDFIDNLLNHMSSKFNQESTLPKQAEISMDETFKWRALKNNTFASRSKNGRSKIKSKDKDKQDAVSKESNVSSDENNKSDNSQDPTTADVPEGADIEIEIAHDISGAEIQEVLALTQGSVPISIENLSEPQQVSPHEEIETVNIANNSEIIESSSCITNIEHINDEVSETVVHSMYEQDVTRSEDNPAVEEKQTEDTQIDGEKPEQIIAVNKEPNDHDAEQIFIHMSSTFNGSCLTKSSSTDNLLPMQSSSPANEEVSSSNLEVTENNNASGNVKVHSSPTSVRRSKRLKQDLVKEPELIDMEQLSNQQTYSLELPSISSKPSEETSHEQTDKNDIMESNDDKTDSAVRTLRSKSFEIKPNEPDAKAKAIAKKKFKNDPKMQESPRKNEHVKEDSPDTRKMTRSKTILRKMPTTRKTQLIRSNYPTRQRNRSVDINAEKRKRSSRFWKNAKSQTSKLRKESSEQKLKHSQETPKEISKAKNPKERSPKRSVRLSRDGSDGILASAIARREKNDTTGFQGRLSRPIKLSAKILANDELRYGFELQNSARLNLNTEVKDPSLTQDTIESDVEPSSEKLEVIEETLPIPVSQPDNIPEQPVPEPLKLPVPVPLNNVQVKCPEPLDFLNEVRKNNLGNKKSPECNSNLTKIQQRRLLKLKEKHFFMLGLRKTNNKKTLIETREKCIETTIVNNKNDTKYSKEDTETVTHSSGALVNTSTNTQNTEIEDNTRSQPEVSIHVLPAAHLQSKLLCYCQRDTRYFTTKSQSRMYCTATDDIDGQFIGCSNELEGGLQNLLRPSSTASYQLLCLTHQRRLHHHGCCATCGVYCTQGYFVICSNRHLFHRECAEKFIVNTKGKSSPIIPKLVLKCPHCGLESVIREYEVRLQRGLSFGIVTTRH